MLCSRHPQFTGPSRDIAEHCARQICEALCANDPDLRMFAAMGWQQQFDEPIVQKGYSISSDGKMITCHTCGSTSHNRNDVANRYCGKCHKFHPKG